MDKIIRYIFRILSLLPYILLITSSFFLIYRKNKYRKAIKENWKNILINTILVFILASIGFYIFFSIEDFVYDYDYAGNWIRNLTLREMFYGNPKEILNHVHHSLNNDIYTYLPALLSLPAIIINNSFGFYNYGTFILFVMPIFIVFQILYFSYFKKHKFLPILIFISFVILYISIFDGEAEVSGMFPLLMCYILTIFVDFEDIDLLDNLSINIYAFLAIFIRRFYLYAILVYYLCYFFKYLKYHEYKIFNKKALLSLFKIILSGLIMLIIILIFYPDFFLRAIYSGYGEEYAFNDHSGKLAYFISCISPIISLISLYGIYSYYKERKNIFMIIILIISIFLPAILFWQVQSFELHHYFISLIGIIIFYTYGLYYIFESKYKFIPILISILLLFQTTSVFAFERNIPLLIGINRKAKISENKNELQAFMNYLIENCGTGEDARIVYFATGDTTINSDLIKNSILPNLKTPNILTNVFDIRDGFPTGIKYASYVITSEPTLYLRKDYQHIYDIISDALKNNEDMKKIYNLKDSIIINDIKFNIYQKTGEYTPVLMKYFYDEVMKYYPDKADLFKNIIE